EKVRREAFCMRGISGCMPSVVCGGTCCCLARLHTTPYALYPAFNRLVTLGKFAATHHFSPEPAFAPHPPGDAGTHQQREQHAEPEAADVRGPRHRAEG